MVGRPRKKDSVHYVSNKDFYTAMVDWKDKIESASNDNEPPPPIPNYVGECFMKIASKLSNRPNFNGYTYKDEMISDGIENCIQYADRFNPEKSNNPFAYFTQIIYYAFLRRIQREKKQSRVKDAMIKGNIEGFGRMRGDWESYQVTPLKSSHLWYEEKDSEPIEVKRKTKKKKPKEEQGLERFLEESEDEENI